VFVLYGYCQAECRGCSIYMVMQSVQGVHFIWLLLGRVYRVFNLCGYIVRQSVQGVHFIRLLLGGVYRVFILYCYC
jgi:hypothetical protein